MTDPRLTPAERDLLRLVATGLTDAGIAGRLEANVHTIKSRIRVVMRKLDAHCRTELVARWLLQADPGDRAWLRNRFGQP